MIAQQRWRYVALILVVILVQTRGDESVRLLPKSPNSPLTSSTLRWVHGAEAGSYVTETVRGAALRPDGTDFEYAADGTEEDDEVLEEAEVTEVDDDTHVEVQDGSRRGSVLVCRARHNGDWLPGALVGDKCLVSLANKVAPYKRFDVLRNVEGAARLQWRKWTRFNGRPYGAVSADGLGYVARRHADSGARQTHYVGRLDLSEGLGRVFVMEPEGKGWKESDYTDGEVLVELEPVRYELKDVRFNERRIKLHQKPRVLATTVLRRESSEDGEESNDATPQDTNIVATALTYWNEPSSEYWGQGRGMLRGLSTIIHVPGDQEPRELGWGVNATTPGSELAVSVQAALLPDTALNVTVTGNHTQSETPYTARLVAYYKDEKIRERIINGTVHQVSLRGVKIEYGAHYFLHDGSLVPTTTTTTTTTTAPPSTTAAATTTTTKRTLIGQNQTIDEKSAPITQGESTSEPLPVTNKNVMSSSDARQSRPLFLLITLFALLLPFRTGT